jgi:2-desacetyl-2-hydroxyethyl bacteriochlorophyllide A dehydrogenase
LKAVVVESVGKVSCIEVAKPIPRKEEVLVKVKAAGLCGSDFHIFNGSYPANYPLIPGHEFTGVIEDIGKDVKGWEIGRRVTADPNIYCHSCYYCLKDQENMCENAQALGVTRDGGFAEYAVVPYRQLYALPDRISFEEGALIEPLSCVVYAMKRLKARFGDNALIFGAGAMGLLLLQALKIGGASETVVVDVVAQRLDAASKLGAVTFACADELKSEYKRGFDIVIDATGNPDVIENMFQFAGKRAKILQFGCADSFRKISISPFQIYDNDWEYIGTRALLYTFTQAIDLLNGGGIRGNLLINDFIGLDALPDYLRNGKPPSSLKVMVTSQFKK